MDELQVPSDKPEEKPKGCGCGSTNLATNPPLTEQQQRLISRIQKTNQRKNSIYKTNTRYFM